MPHYYDPAHLTKFRDHRRGEQGTRGQVFDWYGAVFKEGALGEREKALIALAVAHADAVPYCIDAYAKTCLEKGADLDQMTEAVMWRRRFAAEPAWCTASRCSSTSRRRGCEWRAHSAAV